MSPGGPPSFSATQADIGDEQGGLCAVDAAEVDCHPRRLEDRRESTPPRWGMAVVAPEADARAEEQRSHRGTEDTQPRRNGDASDF